MRIETFWDRKLTVDSFSDDRETARHKAIEELEFLMSCKECSMVFCYSKIDKVVLSLDILRLRNLIADLRREPDE